MSMRSWAVFGLFWLILGTSTTWAQEGRGCSAFKPCPKGFKCEAFTQVCRGPGRAGDSCHMTRPCGPGLTCEAGSQKCRGPGREGDSCHMTRPCGAGLTCEAGSQKCRGPGREGDSCHMTRPCGGGLTCEAGSQKCRAPGKLKDACHATRPCGEGLSCQPGVHECYHSPRQAGEPCSAGYGCGEGFYCQSFVHKCVPKTVEFKSNSPCSSLRVQAVAEDAKRARMAMSFGVGSTVGAGAFLSYETGLVYGEKGEFGCYATACVGAMADASVSSFANFGVYNGYRNFEGFSMVTGGGGQIPFIELGFQATQVWSAQAPKRAKDFLKERLVGTAAGLSFGVGLNPVSVNSAFCYTARLDSGDPLNKFKDIKNQLEAWGKVDFAPDKRPALATAGGSGGTQGGGGGGGVTPEGAVCAQEGGQCGFSGRARVFYGADTRWVVREHTNGVACNNSVFGDPARGTRKSCRFVPVQPPGGGGVRPEGAVCAQEGGQCAFSGRARVFYGADARWVMREHTNGVACNNRVFGDPARGTRKACRFVLLQPPPPPPPPPGNGVVPKGTQCAEEGGRCGFQGKARVYYGANNRWVVREFINGTNCTNAVFTDPIPGTRKACRVEPIATPAAPGAPEGTPCADEGGTCVFRGLATVYYGANATWRAKSFKNGVACTNASFGDPLPGVRKRCILKTGGFKLKGGGLKGKPRRR